MWRVMPGQFCEVLYQCNYTTHALHLWRLEWLGVSHELMHLFSRYLSESHISLVVVMWSTSIDPKKVVFVVIIKSLQHFYIENTRLLHKFEIFLIGNLFNFYKAPTLLTKWVTWEPRIVETLFSFEENHIEMDWNHCHIQVEIFRMIPMGCHWSNCSSRASSDYASCSWVENWLNFAHQFVYISDIVSGMHIFNEVGGTFLHKVILPLPSVHNFLMGISVKWGISFINGQRSNGFFVQLC